VKSPDKTTEELAREIKRGFNVEENFRQLFERRYPQIRRFFQRKGFSPEDSYELTQETFLSVYKGLKDFRQESSFDSWMFSIAENIWRSELERRKARKRDAPLISLDQEVASLMIFPLWRLVSPTDRPINWIVRLKKRSSRSSTRPCGNCPNK
jgi:RNA polymerase sigma factor (sigma-70 family)